jgi:hypothetical protein
MIINTIIQDEVFWVVTLCNVMIGYQRFRGPCCLLLQGEVNGIGKKGIDIGMEYKRGAQSCNEQKWEGVVLQPEVGKDSVASNRMEVTWCIRLAAKCVHEQAVKALPADPVRTTECFLL